jgi:hypothetical protein
MIDKLDEQLIITNLSEIQNYDPNFETGNAKLYVAIYDARRQPAPVIIWHKSLGNGGWGHSHDYYGYCLYNTEDVQSVRFLKDNITDDLWNRIMEICKKIAPQRVLE